MNEGFGKYMVAYNQTIVVSAPAAFGDFGAVYIFNGTLRHWTQLQRLIPENDPSNQPLDPKVGDKFGTKIHLDKDRLIIGAQEATFKHPNDGADCLKGGAVYVYERPNEQLFWSFQAKLIALDAMTDNYFGENFALKDDATVIGARNDNEKIKDVDGNGGDYTGSAYVFRKFSGKWSQQQKLIAHDMLFFHPDRHVQPAIQSIFYGNKKFNYDIALDENWLAVGTARVDAFDKPLNAVYLFREQPQMHRWSLQQRLWTNEHDLDESWNVTEAQMEVHLKHDTLISTMRHSTPLGNETGYVFVLPENSMADHASGSGWSQLQELKNRDLDSGVQQLSNAQLWGSQLLYRGDQALDIYSQYHDESCLLLWASDHFGDGWDIAMLTVVAPDGSNDTFHPSCNQIDPFHVRYCPMAIQDTGVYTVKVFAPTMARFFWEISWQVQIEVTCAHTLTHVRTHPRSHPYTLAPTHTRPHPKSYTHRSLPFEVTIKTNNSYPWYFPGHWRMVQGRLRDEDEVLLRHQHACVFFLRRGKPRLHGPALLPMHYNV